MWFATDHGVTRYNGYEFLTFTTKDGLSDNTVFKLFEDDKKRVWMLTFSGKVFYFENPDLKSAIMPQLQLSLFHKEFTALVQLFLNRILYWLTLYFFHPFIPVFWGKFPGGKVVFYIAKHGIPFLWSIAVFHY